MQLTTHLSKLNDEVKLDQDWIKGKKWEGLKNYWIKLCAVFPCYEDNQNVAKNKVEKAQAALGGDCSDIFFVCKTDLTSSVGWLEKMLDLPQPSNSWYGPIWRWWHWFAAPFLKRRQTVEYLKVFVWCLLHSFGVILAQRSKLIDEKHTAAFTEEPKNTPISKTDVAFLTAQQYYVLNNSAHAEKPALIIGAPGTGKTFLLLAKLKQLQDQGLLKSDAKALVILEATQGCLYWDLREKLSPFGDKVLISQLRAVQSYNGDVFRGLQMLLKGTTGVGFVFVDQVEDFIFINTRIMDEISSLCQGFKNGKTFCLMWFLWNGMTRGANPDILDLRMRPLHPSIYVPALDDSEQLYGKGLFA